MNGDTHPQQDGEPKIIVDSDWKEQVALEKKKATDPAVDEVTDSQPEPRKPDAPPPPASFEFLVFNLINQAMMLLGQMPDPVSGELSINKPYAKYYIDTLEILSDKTKGNLTDDEAEMISESLHALRMTYVNVKSP